MTSGVTKATRGAVNQGDRNEREETTSARWLAFHVRRQPLRAGRRAQQTGWCGLRHFSQPRL